MLDNKKRTFELLEQIYGEGGDRIIIEVAGKDYAQACWLAGVAKSHLDNIEEEEEYVEFNENMGCYIFSYWYEMEDNPDDTLDFRLFLDTDVCTNPYYSLKITVYSDDVDEDSMSRFHIVLRKKGKDGTWQPGYMPSSYTQQGRGKCATCPRYHICSAFLGIEE